MTHEHWRNRGLKYLLLGVFLRHFALLSLFHFCIWKIKSFWSNDIFPVCGQFQLLSLCKCTIIKNSVFTEHCAKFFMTSLDSCLQDISDFGRKELSLSERAFYQACEGNWALCPVVLWHAGRSIVLTYQVLREHGHFYCQSNCIWNQLMCFTFDYLTLFGYIIL